MQFCECLYPNELNIPAKLTYFMPLISFCTPLKHLKTLGFLMLSGGIEEEVT